MRNRAKCKLCQEIIESMHRHDYVKCKCGEIFVDGGNDYLKAGATNWENFLRVDDEGNEIIVQVKDKIVPIEDEKEPLVEDAQNKHIERMKILDDMIENIENLPAAAMSAYVTHYDMASALILIRSIFQNQ